MAVTKAIEDVRAKFAETCRLHAEGVASIIASIQKEFPGIKKPWLDHFFRLRMGHYDNPLARNPFFRVVYQRPESADRPTTACPCRRGDRVPDVERYIADLRAQSGDPPPIFSKRPAARRKSSK